MSERETGRYGTREIFCVGDVGRCPGAWVGSKYLLGMCVNDTQWNKRFVLVWAALIIKAGVKVRRCECLRGLIGLDSRVDWSSSFGISLLGSNCCESKPGE